MPDENTDTKKCCSSSMAYANLILRLWVGLRLFMAGLDKFREGNGFKNVSFSMFNYNNKTERIAKLMADNSFLPEGMCFAYAKSIGFILLAVGVWVTVGICTELGLLAAGLTFLSLGFGLAVLPDDTEVVYIGIHMLIVAAALATSKSNKFSLDGLFGRKKRD